MHKRKSINKYRRSLSDRESRILSSLSYDGRAIFTLDDIARLDPNPRSALDNMVRKKWVLKLKKGVYAVAPLEAGKEGAENHTIHGFAIASFLVEPYYIGYWSALNYHGLTEQTPPSVYVATTRPRNSRVVLDTRFRFVTIPKRKMFGLDDVEIEQKKIKVSSPEKTIVDCLDHPEHCGGVEEVAKAIYFSKDELDFIKTADFARRLGNGTVFKRLGYIAEALDIKEYLDAASGIKLKSGYSVLDPTLPKKGKIRERWKILVNAPIRSDRWMV